MRPRDGASARTGSSFARSAVSSGAAGSGLPDAARKPAEKPHLFEALERCFRGMAPRRATGEARAEADLDFERLYAGHRGEVFRAALRELGNVHDAEDVTQAAFIDAYRAVLRGSRPEAPRA